ncbi:ATP-binding protein [Balneolales bacterium ANBcel1]|nr:ATP-binding protein [Balneolales bacterium ANBcel1]
MGQNFSLTLLSDLEEIDRVTAFVEQLTPVVGCDSDAEHRIMLALTEAVTNAILHGNRQQRSLPVEITASVDAARLRLTVRDQGKGFDPNRIPDPRSKENLLKSSGRGVLLMRELADKVTYTENGRCVELTFNRNSK